MSSHAITNWKASNGELEITVISKPLSMVNTYVWKYHTDSWWHENRDQTVFEVEAQDLLTSLVYSHEILSKLVDYYRIPALGEN